MENPFKEITFSKCVRKVGCYEGGMYRCFKEDGVGNEREKQ